MVGALGLVGSIVKGLACLLREAVKALAGLGTCLVVGVTGLYHQAADQTSQPTC